MEIIKETDFGRFMTMEQLEVLFALEKLEEKDVKLELGKKE
ncbi:MAG: hypothetical protein ACREBW_10415 [Candidatus Micrarchaeaceae archaeon]